MAAKCSQFDWLVAWLWLKEWHHSLESCARRGLGSQTLPVALRLPVQMLENCDVPRSCNHRRVEHIPRMTFGHRRQIQLDA